MKKEIVGVHLLVVSRFPKVVVLFGHERELFLCQVTPEDGKDVEGRLGFFDRRFPRLIDLPEVD